MKTMREMHMGDWIVSTVAAFCVALGVYIVFNHPEIIRNVILGCVGVVLVTIVVYFYLDGRRSDANRTRSHQAVTVVSYHGYDWSGQPCEKYGLLMDWRELPDGSYDMTLATCDIGGNSNGQVVCVNNSQIIGHWDI